jgi:hypothetical protein
MALYVNRIIRHEVSEEENLATHMTCYLINAFASAA